MKLHVKFLMKKIEKADKEELEKIKNHLTGKEIYKNLPNYDIPNHKTGEIIEKINTKLLDFKKSYNKNKIKSKINDLFSATSDENFKKHVSQLSRLMKNILYLKLGFNSTDSNIGRTTFIKAMSSYE